MSAKSERRKKQNTKRDIALISFVNFVVDKQQIWKPYLMLTPSRPCPPQLWLGISSTSLTFCVLLLYTSILTGFSTFAFSKSFSVSLSWFWNHVKQSLLKCEVQKEQSFHHRKRWGGHRLDWEIGDGNETGKDSPVWCVLLRRWNRRKLQVLLCDLESLPAPEVTVFHNWLHERGS